MFTAKQRKIYRFSNGERTIARDPVKLLRKLEATRPPHYEKLVEAVKSGDVQQYSPAVDILIPWIEGVFGVQALDDEGWGFTEEELFDLLSDFMTFVKKKDGPTDPSPNSSPSTPESTPSGTDPSPTPTTSDCGCTE